MKRKRRGRMTAASTAEIGAAFTRGFVATGLLSALQGRGRAGGPPPWRRILRHSVQGGAALAAGTVAAEAIQRRDYGVGIAAIIAGGAVVAAAETVLHSQSIEENCRGQEEQEVQEG
ncbi:hypothetical protein [Magnetospirillum sp. SS-4]|uniref:hypothetical protein n=1 Tax=Magnetospirillum sp. SS-4 TaxID=2681465 RepID=UPI001384CDCA|nr:hypothetical protein [Magnetospirillum sp. SS-4]CAA7622437.1 conserved hypothetical protein [Magnetospirillum sp. SS-4]